MCANVRVACIVVCMCVNASKLILLLILVLLSMLVFFVLRCPLLENNVCFSKVQLTSESTILLPYHEEYSEPHYKESCFFFIFYLTISSVDLLITSTV